MRAQQFKNTDWYGWAKDSVDKRDYLYAAKKLPLPSSVDLRKLMPRVWDQGPIGSCTAHAIAAAVEFCKAKQGQRLLDPSRLFIYYNERLMEGTVNRDSGAQIRTGIKSVAKQGACGEPVWPYIAKRLTIRPSAIAYKQALMHKALVYTRLDNSKINDLKDCLAGGFPFVFGFMVYESFEGQEIWNTGIQSMPQPGEKAVGGHAVLAVGYDDSKQAFLVRNSWGTDWGIQGYYWAPYNYLTNTNLAFDFWTIKKEQ